MFKFVITRRKKDYKHTDESICIDFQWKKSSHRSLIEIKLIELNFLNEYNMISSSDQTIRRLQDELDNTTQLLESIRSKGIQFLHFLSYQSYYSGADLTQLTNFLDGTLSHIRASDSSATPLSTTVSHHSIV